MKKVNLREKRVIIAASVFLLLSLIGVIIFQTINLHGAAVAETKLVDLSDYPEMFVSEGIFDGYIVVGENAYVVDSLVATEIASRMKIVKNVTATSLTGDFWAVDGLEMANSNTDAGSIQGENIYDVSSYITRDDLNALADGVYKTASGSYDYAQYLYFDVNNTATNQLVKYAENDDNVEDIFFFVASGKNIGQYRLEFTTRPKSDIYDTAGSTSSSGTQLKGFDDTRITMLGREYTIVLARRPQTNRIALTLMTGATSGSLLEGETQTFKLNSGTYEASLIYVDSTSVKFSINGEETSTLHVGDTYKLSDGSEVGVSEILYQSYAGGVHSADFFIGVDKVELKDNDITDSDSDNEVEINGETIDGAEVIILGVDDSTSVTLSAITINMVAQDDYYVPANSNLSSIIELAGDEPELLFTGNWDMEFKGLSDAKSQNIKLDSRTNRKYDLVFYDGNGDQVDLPLFYAVDDTTVSFGENADENCLILRKGVPIYKDDYFVLTGGNAASGSASSFGLQYKGADSSTTANPNIKFKNLGSGETLEYSVDTSSTAAGSAVTDIRLGGHTFSIVSEEAETSNDFAISISGSDDIDVVDEYGVQLDFGSIPGTNCRNNTGVASSAITINTANNGDYGNQAPSEIILTVDATATNQVTVSSFTIGGTSNPLFGDGSTAYGYTSLGGKLTYTSPSSSPNEFTYEYPKEQKVPLLYVTSGAVASPATSGNLVSVDTTGTTRLDSEVSALDKQNLIIVGGPCVNTVAAELLGDPANCEEGFAPGKAVIRLFENDGKIAMMVAGYNGTETRLAGKVVANRWTDLSGKEVEISGDNYLEASITVLEK